MTEVVKTIKACHIKDGMRIRFDHGAYTLEGDVKSVEDYGGSLVDVTFERDGNGATILITRNADVDVLKKPVPKEPKNPGAVVKYTNSWGASSHFVRAKADESEYPWVHTSVNLEFSWFALANDNDCTVEVLFEGVNIDD